VVVEKNLEVDHEGLVGLPLVEQHVELEHQQKLL
jgi:hypothetical protein